MSHNTFAFWICTLFSGIVIGIASQRIPEVWAEEEVWPKEIVRPHSYVEYANVYKVNLGK